MSDNGIYGDLVRKTWSTGLRPALAGAVAAATRGGRHYGQLIEQVRILMDRVRMLDPDDEVAVAAIALLEQLNERLGAAVVDEWSTPIWTRNDVPANGNITLPPFVFERADRDGVTARITFRDFHLGGNSAAHGGYIAVAFDTMLGVAAGLYTGTPIRTASLTVDYRSITPLQRELTIHAQVESRADRKIFTTATLRDGARVCAEARALFLILAPGQQ
ncbi:PaaI family thioesterase [Nocardia goodfellowii]